MLVLLLALKLLYSLQEQVSPTNLSIGTHFGVQVNHPHAIENQSGLRWGFQTMFQVCILILS